MTQNFNRFSVSLGSIPGPYHLKSGLPNQDSVLYQDEGDWLFGGVADGAGSLKYSDEGSFIALRTAIDSMVSLRKSLGIEELVETSVMQARKALLAKPDAREFGATLSIVALHSSGEWASAAVGDSYSVIHEENGNHKLITGAKPGEYANLTELLTSKKINVKVDSGINAIGFSSSTDGLERVSLQNNEAHPGFWDGIRDKAIAENLEIHRLFDWLNSLDKIEDDTSLLTVVRK